MENIDKLCITKRSCSKIVLSENRSKLIFDNPHRKEVNIVKVDGCAIKEGRKCDYLLLTTDKVEHYVELKGSNIDYAFKQLEESFIKLSQCIKTQLKHAYVISTRSPLATTKIQSQRINFLRKYNSNLTVKNIECKVQI